MVFIPNRMEPYRPPKEPEPTKAPQEKPERVFHPEEVRQHVREHQVLAHETIVSGESQQTSEEHARQQTFEKRARFRQEEEVRLLAPRIIWWIFIIALGINWLYEITVFTWWWGWGGVFIGFVIGIPLTPLFPIIALLQGDYGIALSAVMLLAFLSMTLVYSWPEMARFIRGLRARR